MEQGAKGDKGVKFVRNIAPNKTSIGSDILTAKATERNKRVSASVAVMEVCCKVILCSTVHCVNNCAEV